MAQKGKKQKSKPKRSESSKKRAAERARIWNRKNKVRRREIQKKYRESTKGKEYSKYYYLYNRGEILKKYREKTERNEPLGSLETKRIFTMKGKRAEEEIGRQAAFIRNYEKKNKKNKKRK